MNELNYLITTALFIGTVHTLIGIDHYVPFIVLSKANDWTMKKTLMIVFICGIGHVLSSTVLGFVGIALSQSIAYLVDIESLRGTLATYFMIGFGLTYTLWAIRNTYMNRPHTHLVDGKTLEHHHQSIESVDVHHDSSPKTSINTLWGLFILFVLGPCEPLIPLLMYPASSHNTYAFIAVLGTFSICTLLTMLFATWLGLKGINAFRLKSLEKHSHTLAGLAITICGVMILTLGI